MQEEAYWRGKADQRLDDHDKHFARLNGSLEKMTDGFAALSETVDGVATSLRLRDEAVVQAQRHTFTRRQLWVGSIGLLIAAAGPFVAPLLAGHHP